MGEKGWLTCPLGFLAFNKFLLVRRSNHTLHDKYGSPHTSTLKVYLQFDLVVFALVAAKITLQLYCCMALQLHF